MRARRLKVYGSHGHVVGSIFLGPLSMSFRVEFGECRVSPYTLALLPKDISRKDFILEVRKYCKENGMRIWR